LKKKKSNPVVHGVNREKILGVGSKNFRKILKKTDPNRPVPQTRTRATSSGQKRVTKGEMKKDVHSVH